MSKKNQSGRLTTQHKISQGVIGIFGEEAQLHDKEVYDNQYDVKTLLGKEFPRLKFRFRPEISKREINEALRNIDSSLGQTLYVQNSNIKPDGGLIEVLDDKGNWRVVLVSEAKHQGKDIENIRSGILVGKNNDQDLMVAGNAIECSHKNIAEIANYMLNEAHFPYILFLEGSNFLMHDITIERPEGRNSILIDNDINSKNYFNKHLENMQSVLPGKKFIQVDSLETFYEKITNKGDSK